MIATTQKKRNDRLVCEEEEKVGYFKVCYPLSPEPPDSLLSPCPLELSLLALCFTSQMKNLSMQQF